MQARQTPRCWLLLLIALPICSGCVRRRLTVRTNPPGAMVYVDRQFIGPSPASTSVTYYGTRHIEVVGDGYRTEKILRTFNPPWYQIPPLDFISETLWPWEIRDQRVVDITMVADQPVPSEELIGRADTMRTQVAAGIAVPLTRTQGPADIPPPTTVPVLPPAAPVPAIPVEPGAAPVLPPPINEPWRPGQILRNLIQPGGEPVERIPAVGGLQGGGYRPTVP
ncbi:MAG: PEGA domain-containing protein [Aureliella sp.]